MPCRGRAQFKTSAELLCSGGDGGRGLIVFICLCRLHRLRQLNCTHNKVGMMCSMWETAGVRQARRLQSTV